ncbi:MAG: MoaD/ThiS family protein [Proteobacteria bacterium]|nr:MoaD/ThiS family protein [Pseudomonadota bacterium]
MHITIKLFAMLREGRFDTKIGEFPVGTMVCEIIQQLGIPEKEVTLIFINGRHRQPNTRLMDGDTVALFPPVGGG